MFYMFCGSNYVLYNIVKSQKGISENVLHSIYMGSLPLMDEFSNRILEICLEPILYTESNPKFRTKLPAKFYNFVTELAKFQLECCMSAPVQSSVLLNGT
jgi:hypothetical protein